MAKRRAKHRIYGYRVTDEGETIAIFADEQSAISAANALEDTYDTGGFDIHPVYHPIKTISWDTFKKANPNLIFYSGNFVEWGTPE